MVSMGLAMAPHRQPPGQYKEEPNDSHHPHHPQQQGPAPSHIQPHPRPSSIVQPHPHAPPQQASHSSPYPPAHSIPSAYQHQQQQQQQQGQSSSAQHAQDIQYYPHQSPYSTPGATSGYTSADTSEMMAATMPRPPYPPMSYHTPQSNSPASVASSSGHDQQRSMYAQPTSQLHQQSMYYSQQQYPPMPTQTAPSPYGQHPQQTHQTMTSQPNMMMSHSTSAQHQIPQHAQAGMTGSPRHPTKMESHNMPQLQRPSQPASIPQSSMAQPQSSQNGAPMPPPGASGGGPGVNPNAAPGPIPATTPLVVRQDQNGVQWIAFEYSRDRVKMEYTIRCDVESVNTDELAPEFKADNCVYPRACCPKDQYRGNRLQYETECNTVGWALAQLNPPLRGKRGLIQRAVDSWRNSNQDPRLRSRRVRRMAKMTSRSKATPHPHPAAHMNGPGGPAGMPGPMGPGAPSMGKPSMGSMGPMHHHHAHADGSGQGSGEEVGDGDSFSDDQHHHHHQAPVQPGGSGGSQDDMRSAHVFNSGYGPYGSNAPGGTSISSIHDAMSGTAHHGGSSAIAARRHSRSNDEPDDLFPDIPEAKKRKFILVEDSDRQSRLRVRVTLDGVDTREIPDSFRKNSSVFPRSYFPREMQSPPPSATGSKFFNDDASDAEDDGATETEGRRASRGGGGNNNSSASGSRGKTMVKVPMADGSEGEVAIPRMRKSFRGKEVRLNDLGFRMAWLQSRVFSGRTIFLQRALDCYRNKTRTAIESIMQDVKSVSPHFETRVGKRRWNERMRRVEKKEEES